MKERYKENCKLLAKNVQYYRKLHGYTQKQLAVLIGRSRPHITKIERGHTGASFNTLSSLAEAFHVPLYKLLEPGE